MTRLELLAPARNMEIGIAAISCGADAVYIAGPEFGARQAAGNSIEDIRQLCTYAHRFGARIFVTLNTILYDHELEAARQQLLDVQEAGADAVIVQDLALLKMADKIPLHASTQCAIQTPEQAVFLAGLGFSRLILEREMSLEQIRAIHEAVDCELEFFVHGALCVCYSGQCYLSEMIDGRSANRGACMQACRSRYDLVDSKGKVLVKDSALLSLKDYNLIERLEDLAGAGVQSFKIEGRLKNISYVRNVVRAYSQALDRLVARYPEKYRRASVGSVECDFTPDLRKTFNRGYTQLFIDGKRGSWASGDAAKSMGEPIGKVASVNRNRTEVRIAATKADLQLNNGDGFSYVGKDGKVHGFRGDVCQGLTIRCQDAGPLQPGCKLFRNIDTAFEKDLEKSIVRRTIRTDTSIHIVKDETGKFLLHTTAVTEDGRSFTCDFDAGRDPAQNTERIQSMLQSQISKITEEYRFNLKELDYEGELPFMSAAFMNNIRRTLAEGLSAQEVTANQLTNRNQVIRENLVHPAAHFWGGTATYKQNVANKVAAGIYAANGAGKVEAAYELEHPADAELMRTRYCIRYEMGLCPIHQGAKPTGPLFLVNNGRKLALDFDCKNCEMVISLQSQK